MKYILSSNFFLVFAASSPFGCSRRRGIAGTPGITSLMCNGTRPSIDPQFHQQTLDLERHGIKRGKCGNTCQCRAVRTSISVAMKTIALLQWRLV